MPRTRRKTLADVVRPEGRPDYSCYLFTRNPFRLMPVAVESPPFLTDRDEIFDELKELVRISLHNQRMQGCMVSADFGMGKSHMLKFLKHLINTQLREGTEARAVAAYAIPGKGMLDLYMGIVEDLGEEFLIEVSQGISTEYPDIQPRAAEGQQYAFWSESHFVPKYVNDLWQALPPSARKRMNKDWFAALIFLQDAKYRSDALYWLQGGKPKKADRDAMGIGSWITEDTAQEVFVTLVTAIREAGYDHFYLCLDEMEKLTYLTTRPRSEYFEQLRYVIDQLVQGFSLFGAVTTEAWQSLEEAQHAFQSRLRQFHRLQLAPMELSQVVELVGDYMYEERLSYAETSLETDDYPYDRLQEIANEADAPIDVSDESALELFPFSREVIEAIGRETKGNPRDVLRACAWLIDRGYSRGWIYSDIEQTLGLLGQH